MPGTSPDERQRLRAVADVLEAERHAIADRLLQNACLIPRWAVARSRHADEPDEFIASEGHVFVDYLVLWLRSGDDTFEHLYIGEKLKQLYDENGGEGDASARRAIERRLIEADQDVLEEFVRGRVADEAAELFSASIRAMHDILLGEGETTLRVLFVGDCIHLDVMAFIAGPCLEDGITLDTCFATSKNPDELGRHLRSLGDRKFDVVFYSPFSYEFDPQFAQLLQPESAFLRGAVIDSRVDASLDIVEAQLGLIEDLFDCPIHVHNTANIVREESDLKRRMKVLLTRRTRRRAAQRVDARVRELIQARNARSFRHVFLMDEIALARPFDESILGAYFYRSSLQHPCRFSKEVASAYADVLAVHAHLLGKKLVVCDLDNTLWEGVIGEGAVQHHHDRQAALMDLKSRGVVLSINSKNDPGNVDFAGGTLGESDFVYADIDWEPKINGLRRTEQALNLKARDFVFIDDRADEREMSTMAFPDLIALDPCEDRTWRRFRLWYELLDPELASDRTSLYQAREARREFLQNEETSGEQSRELFKSLDLRLNLRKAAESDLKRVHELINRTNQFNLCGTRVTFTQVEEWSASEKSLILVADARDRFGDMGTVGILVLAREADRWDVPVFVLSCRVFGYGIERAMLNATKGFVRERTPDAPRISGEYRETGRNQPCRDVYAENGFVEVGGRWVFEGAATLPDAEWLTIESDL